MKSNELMLFAMDASRAFGEAVSRELGVPLAAHEEREFEDQEHKTRSLANVRDRDVFVIHSLYADATQSGNDKLCRLLFFIGALRDAAAGRITASVQFETEEEACGYVLSFGNQIEVLSPPELRQKVAELAKDVVRLNAPA